MNNDPKPGGNSTADHLLRLVHSTSAASRQLRRRLCEVAASIDLTDTELMVVWFCGDSGRVQVELAGAIGVSPAQMSGIVERLRSAGLIAMHRPAADRRRQVWRMSPAGQSLLDRAAEPLKELAASIGEALDEGELQMAQLLCERLAETVAHRGRGRSGLPVKKSHHDRQRASKEAA
jgi:DNA-binding MarR family transcriptional regulator